MSDSLTKQDYVHAFKKYSTLQTHFVSTLKIVFLGEINSFRFPRVLILGSEKKRGQFLKIMKVEYKPETLPKI